MYNKKIILSLISFFVIICITGCSNPFQKKVIITGSMKEEKEKQPKVKQDDNKNEIDEIKNQQQEIIEKSESKMDTSNETFSNDNEVVEYFSNIENETNQTLNSNDKSVKTKVTNFFVNIIDFIFYDKEIKGVKFNDLTDEAKEKVLSIANRMDNSIENKFPNYKENISSTSKKTYNKISDKIKEGLNYLGDKTEEKIGTDNYNKLQDNYEEVKDTTKNAFGIIKDKAKSAKDKVKNWYEEKTGK